MATTPTALMTADELLLVKQRCELIEGVLVELTPPGANHGVISAEIVALLSPYRREHGGLVLGEAGFRLAGDPDTVRAPDAAYIRPARAEGVGRPKGYWPGAPDLAVEVVSPGDTFTEVHEKALGWLAAGATVVLVVDPAAQHVTRYRSADDVVVLGTDQAVACDPAMPGFAPIASALLAVD